MKAQETKDVELRALAALVFQESVLMAAENESRARHGLAPAYGDNGYTPNYYLLTEEMKRRLSELTDSAEAGKERAISQADFDEQIDFLWHALDRKDKDLLKRRLIYLLRRFGHEISEGD